MNPRDPSTVDDAIDLRGPEPGAEGQPQGNVDPGAGRSVDAGPDEGIDDDLGDGPDPDNPFSLGAVAGAPSAPPPDSGTLRRRPDAGDARPLGPGPIPGPVEGPDGSLDLTEVHRGEEAGPGFLPNRPNRLRAESVIVRLVATAGVIGIGTALGAVMSAAGAAGWVTALVVSAVSVALAALLWRSRRL